VAGGKGFEAFVGRTRVAVAMAVNVPVSGRIATWRSAAAMAYSGSSGGHRIRSGAPQFRPAEASNLHLPEPQ
jgi:hypothetical protein